MTKCGFVSLIGTPNSGKSTLLNALIGEKVSIVTPKVQTTRRQIQGILTEKKHQVVFIDTPGIFEAKTTMEQAMVKTAFQSLKDIELVILIVDATKYDLSFIENIKKRCQNLNFCIALNKIDLVKNDIKNIMSEIEPYGKTFPISALKNTNLEELKKFIFEKLPDSPWFYPEDQLTNINQKLWSAEITREKAMILLHQELPYELFVETETWTDRKDKSTVIHQTINVARDNLKGMVLGEGGKMLKKIGTQARVELEAFLKHRVHLFIHVKVQKNWQDKSLILKSLGIIQ